MAPAITSGYPKMLSAGNYNIYLWKVTDIDDAETLTTNLGTRAISHFVTWIGDTTTPAESSGHSTMSSAGLITFYPAEDALDAHVMVIANG